MDRAPNDAPEGLLRIEDCLDADGGVVLPPGVTLISLIERNVANVADSVAYRYLDYSHGADGQVAELTWAQLGRRLLAVGARVQRVASRGDRVAILAPQGLDYIAGFFAAIKAGTIAVPLFAPELPGHAERLDIALADAEPAAVLTTAAAADSVQGFLGKLPFARRPEVIVMDEVPDSAGDEFAADNHRRRRGLAPAVHLGLDASTRGRRDHPSGGRIQLDPDDPVDRPVGSKHPRCQLVTAVPRHGPVDDRLPDGLRRALDPAVADRIHPTAATMDPGDVRRIPDGPRGHCRTEFRLRVDGTARPAGSRRGHRSEQRGDDHRLRTGQHRGDPEVQHRIRAARFARHRVQAVLRHCGGNAVRVDDRGRPPQPRWCISTEPDSPPDRPSRYRRTTTAPSLRSPVARWPAVSGR